MKKLLFISALFFANSAIGQVFYLNYTYNSIKPIGDSLQVNITTNYQVGSIINTIDCNFKVGKNKTWLQLEAIFEQKSYECFTDLIGN
jgi:hypothetical protein